MTDPDAPDLEPGPGDLTVCIGCGSILCFDAAMGLARVSAEQIASWDVDTRSKLTTLSRLVRRVRAGEN
jgi:hypothetical protein